MPITFPEGPETNMSPENRPLEKEIPTGNHPFSGAMLVLGICSITTWVSPFNANIWLTPSNEKSPSSWHQKRGDETEKRQVCFFAGRFWRLASKTEDHLSIVES